MIIENRQKILVLRYGKKPDCIIKHKEVIDEMGYCWFGKLGVVPSTKVTNQVMESKSPIVLLYSSGGAYLARVEKIMFERPQEGTPVYYNEELFDKDIYPGCYFMIRELEKASGDILSSIVICSSRNKVLDTLHHSMSSFFLAEYVEK